MRSAGSVRERRGRGGTAPGTRKRGGREMGTPQGCWAPHRWGRVAPRNAILASRAVLRRERGKEEEGASPWGSEGARERRSRAGSAREGRGGRRNRAEVRGRGGGEEEPHREREGEEGEGAS
eukprot:3322296-Rhodomonas_salina.1